MLLRNQGEKSINLYFIMVPFKEKSIKVWYSKAQYPKALNPKQHKPSSEAGPGMAPGPGHGPPPQGVSRV